VKESFAREGMAERKDLSCSNSDALCAVGGQSEKLEVNDPRGLRKVFERFNRVKIFSKDEAMTHRWRSHLALYPL